MNITRTLIVYIAIPFLMGLLSTTAAYEPDYVVGDRGKTARDHVDTVHDRLGFNGVVLAGREGVVVAAVARGLTGDGANSPLTFKSLFEIASCTKPFTAVAILQLAEKERLSLSDPISKHLPGVPDHCRRITVRHLLGHTSGIPGTNTKGYGDDVEKVTPLFLDGGPMHPPGVHYEYWNQGYALLSEIIARTSGKPYTDYVRDNILQPSDMSASGFTGDRPQLGASVAIGISSRGASRSAFDHPYGSYGLQYRGMGGLVTNVHDLWRWDRALRSGKLIDDDSFKEMTTAGKGDYGLGWFITQDPDGQLGHRHGGSVRGFRAEIRRYPSIDGAVFVLANQDDSLPSTLVTAGVERILFGKPILSEVPSVPPKQFVHRVVGEYRDAKNRSLKIENPGGLPRVTIDWGGPVTRGYLGLDESRQFQLFLATPTRQGVQFKADTRLDFLGSDSRADAVALLSLDPKLTFRRSKP